MLIIFDQILIFSLIFDQKMILLINMDQKMIPLLIFPSKNASEKKLQGSWKKKGLIRKVGPRLYVSNSIKDTPKIIRLNWSKVVSHLFPQAVLSHRSAIEFTPDLKGFIHLTGSTNRIIEYPGLKLKFHKGPKALATDHDFMGFKTSSFERALLENLSVTKKQGTDAGLSVDDLEKKLEELLHIKGEKEINAIRDQAKIISKTTGWIREYQKLNQIIGALLGTKSVKNLKNKSAISRAMGKPYDSNCLERLEILFSKLKQSTFKNFSDKGNGGQHFSHKAFFESYFSNYIEGTTFEVEEAEEIIFDKKIPSKRPQDAHDIIGTYALVSNANEMRQVPKSVEELHDLLKRRHYVLMNQRPSLNPGEFKTKPNRVGDTHFVHPDHVLGTLEQGFSFYPLLPEGFHRAAYIMFLISEVHPFQDGNGRIARVMMNAELVTTNEPTIIIPNVYREDYLLSLRALSRRNRSEPLIKMLKNAQDFSNLDYSNYPKILKLIQDRNWFLEPDESKVIQIN